MHKCTCIYTSVGINIRTEQNSVESRKSFLKGCTKIKQGLQSENQTFSKRSMQFKSSVLPFELFAVDVGTIKELSRIEGINDHFFKNIHMNL